MFLSNLRNGNVKISICGKQLERFLNLCKNRGISLHKAEFCDEEKLECVLSVSDFFSIQQIRRKTHVKIKILKKRGLPFFFHQHKKRKAFFVGCLVILLVMWFLSQRIWVISMEGNVGNTTPEIMKFLQSSGIKHGMKHSKIDCKGLAELLREQYEDITWVSAKLSKSTLTIQIKEGVLPQEHKKEAPCDLAAEKAGTIVKMITRSGVPQKKEGDICESGDLLVSGSVEILNDEKEVVRYDCVHADADVFIQYKIPYYRRIPLEETVSEETGKQKKSAALQLGTWYLDFSGEKESKWKVIRDTKRIRITESFYLPLSITKILSVEYKETLSRLSEEEAIARAKEELWQYEKNLIQKGVQIFVNNVKIEVNHEFCVSYGYLEVIEKIGQETPLLTQEETNRKDIIE